MYKLFKKNYKTVNLITLSFCIYLFIYPLIAKVLDTVTPGITDCAFKKITGIPCPFCGGTRYLTSLKNVFNDPSVLNSPFTIIIGLLIIQLIIKIYTTINRDKLSDNFKKFDFIFTLSIIFYILLYVTIYFLTLF
jgi:hypothetical protein